MIRSRMPFFFVLVCMAFLSFEIEAQEVRATLGGRVIDQSEAVVVGVGITATNTETNVGVSTLSNEAGSYIFPPLIPGTYRVSAENPGFKKFVRDGIVLRVQDKVELVIALEVGEVTTSVEVSKELALIETATATIGQVIGSRLVSELPLNGRNPYLLTGLSMGVHLNNPPQIQRTFDVGGTNSVTTGAGPQRQGGGNNEFILDGAPAEGALNFVPSVSAVQEFKVQTNTFDAEYGRAAGAVVNVSIKSGTNKLHGEVYEFHRNSALDANNFFSNRAGLKKTNSLFHLFGASVGGPVRLPKLYNGKDRTFFFFNYEGVRQGTPATFLDRVPTELERTGDFSRSLNSRGEVITIYDPLSPAPAPGGGFTRTAFPGNRIPANRIDPVAQNMIKYYPLPNLPGETPLGAPNFAKATGTHDDYDQYIARVDHSLTSSNQLFVRVETSARTAVSAPVYDNIADLGGSGAPFYRRSRGAVIQDTHTLSPASILTVRYGYNRLVNQQTLVHEGFDFRTLGFSESLYQAATYKLFPAITIAGFSGIAGTGNFLQAVDGHTGQISLSNIRGKHNLKFGADLRAARTNLGNGQFGASSGAYNFDAAFTQGPNPNVASVTAGHPIASFLLGTPSSGRIDSNAEAAFQGLYYGLFIQDDIKLTPKLTVNAGLRWEYEAPQTERFNRMSRGFDFNATSPVQPSGSIVKGGLLFANDNNRSLGEGDRLNFAPRLGLAYQMRNTTVVRAGYGIFSGKTYGNYTSSALQPGFSASTGFVSSLDGGITPANFLRNPFPQGLVTASGSSLGLATFVGQAVSFVDPGFNQPYTHSFTLNIQQELPKAWLVELGYVGGRGSHLPWTRNWELNQLLSIVAKIPALSGVRSVLSLSELKEGEYKLG
ncbi:MAG: TonB-dependent receptor [Acidobacteria bacterium]|nr:TonB-dependent receptor [Acidobacteriota bacterium]